MVCCLVPPKVMMVHQSPYLVRRSGDEKDEAFLLGVMSSMPFDWYARRLVELHFTFEILDRVPVPRPDRSDPRWTRVVHLAGTLAAKDHRFTDWASAVGVAVGSALTEEQRLEMQAEIDANVAHLYGLSRKQVEHLFSTFHRGWAFQVRLNLTLGHFDAIKETK
jgi:hypothetical protein